MNGDRKETNRSKSSVGLSLNLGTFRILDPSINNPNESFSIESEIAEDAEAENSMYASPVVWVPLSIVSAIMFAVGNAIITSLSKFTYKTRLVMAPGGVLASLTLLTIVSIHERYHGHSNWFKKLYLKNPHHGRFERKNFLCSRLFFTIFMVVSLPIQFFAFTMSYYYATKAGMNNGIIMAIYTLKPIINALAFRVLYKQHLRKFEIVGILLCTASIILIGFSQSDESDEGGKQKYMFISMALMF